MALNTATSNHIQEDRRAEGEAAYLIYGIPLRPPPLPQRLLRAFGLPVQRLMLYAPMTQPGRSPAEVVRPHRLADLHLHPDLFLVREPVVIR